MLEEFTGGKLARSIYTPDDGSAIERRFREPGHSAGWSDNYKYRPDGTLESAETATGKTLFAVSDNIRLKVDRDLIVFRPTEVPPYVVEFVAEDDD